MENKSVMSLQSLSIPAGEALAPGFTEIQQQERELNVYSLGRFLHTLWTNLKLKWITWMNWVNSSCVCGVIANPWFLTEIKEGRLARRLQVSSYIISRAVSCVQLLRYLFPSEMISSQWKQKFPLKPYLISIFDGIFMFYSSSVLYILWTLSVFVERTVQPKSYTCALAVFTFQKWRVSIWLASPIWPL